MGNSSVNFDKVLLYFCAPLYFKHPYGIWWRCGVCLVERCASRLILETEESTRIWSLSNLNRARTRRAPLLHTTVLCNWNLFTSRRLSLIQIISGRLLQPFNIICNISLSIILSVTSSCVYKLENTFRVDEL